MKKNYFKKSKLFTNNNKERLLDIFNDYGINLSSEKVRNINNFMMYSKSSCNINSYNEKNDN